MQSKTAATLRRERMDTTLPVLIDLLLATKAIEGKSPRTIEWYDGMLGRFAAFLGENATIADLTLGNARAYIAHLQSRTTLFEHHPHRTPQDGELAASTIHAYVRCIKVLGAWLQEEGLLSTNPFAKLKRPKLPQPVIEILTDEEIDALLKGINTSTLLGSRQYIMVLLLDTGIRASELCTLTLANTFVNQGYIKVTGKGDKERHVPIGNSLSKALIRYINTWRPQPGDSSVDELVLSPDGFPMTYDGLAQAIKRLGKHVGIPRLHAHLFRHTFAVRYLMNGGDVMTLRLILGHTTLEVTQVYMHLAESHVQLQHSRFSPVDRLGVSRRRRTR